MNDLVIHTDGLTKRYGRNAAVDGLSMEVHRGHVYGLLGPNGSGKTTTMGMLLGLVRPTSEFPTHENVLQVRVGKQPPQRSLTEVG